MDNKSLSSVKQFPHAHFLSSKLKEEMLKIKILV
jgi:hypothetical protein